MAGPSMGELKNISLGNMRNKAKEQKSMENAPPHIVAADASSINQMGTYDRIDISEIEPFIVPEKYRSQYNIKEQPFEVSEKCVAILAKSMGLIGQKEPILVRPYKGHYQILSGHQRVEAAKKIGLSKIKCIIQDLSDEQAVMTVLDANLHRGAPSIVEIQKIKAIVDSLAATTDENGNAYTFEYVAEQFGIKIRQIGRYANLLKLTPKLQQCFEEKYIAIRNVEAVSNIKEEYQDILADFCLAYCKTHNNIGSKAIDAIITYYNTNGKSFTGEQLNELLEGKKQDDFKRRKMISAPFKSIRDELSQEDIKIDIEDEKLYDLVKEFLRQQFRSQNNQE